jgi:hypothetical protein
MALERPLPGQPPDIDALRSLRFQAPAELSSLTYRAPVGEIVNLGRKKQFTEEELYQRVLESNKRWRQSPDGQKWLQEYWQGPGKQVKRNYFGTENGRQKRNEASNRHYHRQKQQP